MQEKINQLKADLQKYLEVYNTTTDEDNKNYYYIRACELDRIIKILES